MNPKAELENFKNIFDKELAAYLKAQEEKFRGISPFTSQFLNNLTNFTLQGGKRLRPALFYNSYLLFGGQDKQLALRLSLFMELLQSFFLIHDDICDKSDLRRGAKTIHKLYEIDPLFTATGEEEHMGRVIALLAGDFACQLAYDVISNAQIDSEVKTKLIAFVSKKVNEVIIGQLQDTIMPFNESVEEKDIELVDKYKTATYTYELPVLAGAYLAGATNGDLAHLQEYTLNAGIAFQVYDDILGLYGNDELTGKPSSSDVKEGKKTLLIIKAIENCSVAEKEKILELLGKQDITQDEVDTIRQIVIKSGSLKYSQNKCTEFVTKAQNSLQKINKHHDDAFNFLYSIAEYSVTRSS